MSELTINFRLPLMELRCFTDVPEDFTKNSVSLCYRNIDCDKINNQILNSMKSEGIIQIAFDTVLVIE